MSMLKQLSSHSQNYIYSLLGPEMKSIMGTDATLKAPYKAFEASTSTCNPLVMSSLLYS